MSSHDNYKVKQGLLVILIFGCFGVAALNFSWIITLGAVLAATAIALFASTTQPEPSHDDHHHH